MAEEPLRRLARIFMDREAGPTLKMPPGADLEGYKADLIARLRQPGPAAPHLADRHGRQPEVAATPVGHGTR